MMDKVMQRIEEALDAYARPFLTEHMGRNRTDLHT